MKVKRGDIVVMRIQNRDAIKGRAVHGSVSGPMIHVRTAFSNYLIHEDDLHVVRRRKAACR